MLYSVRPAGSGHWNIIQKTELDDSLPGPASQLSVLTYAKDSRGRVLRFATEAEALPKLMQLREAEAKRRALLSKDEG